MARKMKSIFRRTIRKMQQSQLKRVEYQVKSGTYF